MPLPSFHSDGRRGRPLFTACSGFRCKRERSAGHTVARVDADAIGFRQGQYANKVLIFDGSDGLAARTTPIAACDSDTDDASRVLDASMLRAFQAESSALQPTGHFLAAAGEDIICTDDDDARRAASNLVAFILQAEMSGNMGSESRR